MDIYIISKTEASWRCLRRDADARWWRITPTWKHGVCCTGGRGGWRLFLFAYYSRRNKMVRSRYSSVLCFKTHNAHISMLISSKYRHISLYSDTCYRRLCVNITAHVFDVAQFYRSVCVHLSTAWTKTAPTSTRSWTNWRRRSRRLGSRSRRCRGSTWVPRCRRADCACSESRSGPRTSFCRNTRACACLTSPNPPDTESIQKTNTNSCLHDCLSVLVWN